jgi:hypothetical protein
LIISDWFDYNKVFRAYFFIFLRCHFLLPY